MKKYAILLFIFLILFSTCKGKEKIPVAKSGVLDLRTWNFAQNGNFKLEGEWEFYWKKKCKSLTDKDLQKPQFSILPAPWKTSKKNPELGDKGFACYRLLVQLPEKPLNLGVIVGVVSSAYRLWINDELFSSNGITGAELEEEKPQWLPLTKYLYTEKRSLQIVFEVSNFHYHKGGPWRHIILGEFASIQKADMVNITLESFLSGSLLIMGLYHIGLFFLRRKEKATLYFGLFCLSVFFRSAVENERILIRFFPNFNWELQLKIIFLSIHSGIFFFASFLLHFFPGEYSPRFVKILKYYMLLVSTIIIFNYARVYSPLISVFRIIVVIFLISTLYYISKAIINKRQGAKTLFSGFILLFIIFINDLLYSMDIIHSFHLVTFGLFLFTFAKAYILSIRFTGALTSNEELTENLEIQNIQLENLNTQKDQYLLQVKAANDRLLKILNVAREMALARDKLALVNSTCRTLHETQAGKEKLEMRFYSSMKYEKEMLLEYISSFSLEEAPPEALKFQKYHYTFHKDQLFIPISITERNVVCILCISGLPDPIDEDFKRFIEMLTESLILSIKNIDYTMQMQDKVRMEMELKTASGIQSTLLPQKLPDLPQLEMHSFYEPASETGGDWFNIYPFTDELVYIFIGDVTGHGVPSALIAAGVYSLVKNYLDFSDKANPPLPSALNTAINNLICDMGKLKYFMTFLSIQLNIRTGELVYSNSAHCPAIVFSKNSYLQLQESGLLLGTPFPLIVQDSSIQLKDNDLIFLYTDGATEAENKEEEFFGEDKLLELIQDGYTKDTEFIIRSVRENISNFLNNKPLKDDITMVAIRYKNVNF